MITLYTFGPMFGLPDPSPFCTKAELLLKLAGIEYRLDHSGFRKAPKGKQPYLDDGGRLVADSTFIRMHIESSRGFDFDAGLSKAEQGIAWSFEKLCEDHLYWAMICERWRNDRNFEAGPARFFDPLPAPIRPLIRAKVRRDALKALHGQGLGRHSPAEVASLADRAIASLAAFLADKPFLMGTRPCGADATVLAFVAGLLCPHFTGPVRDAASRHANLIAYRDRGMARWYPELETGRRQAGSQDHRR